MVQRSIGAKELNLDSCAIMNLFLVSSVLIAGSMLLGELFSRLGVPAPIVFLSLGLLARINRLGWIVSDPRSTAYLVSNLALVMILLDGGMRTKRIAFRTALWPALSLATSGVIITAVLTGSVAARLFGLRAIEGLLLGAIIGSTDAAAVFSLLGKGGLNRRLISTLEVESGSNDPTTVFLTVTLVDLIRSGYPDSYWFIPACLLREFGLGIFLGLGGGWLLLQIIERISLSRGLPPLLVAAGGVGLFALASLMKGSGILAAYLCGFAIGNLSTCNRHDVLQTFESLTWLSQICMFLVLGSLATPAGLRLVLAPALVLALWLMLVARPLSVFVSLLPFRSFTFPERCFLSWMGLRGAVPIMLAILPVMAGLESADLLFNVTFVVVLISLILQGTSLNLAARQLGVLASPTAPPLLTVEVKQDLFPEKSSWRCFVYRLGGGDRRVDTFLKDLCMPRRAYVSAILRGDLLLKPSGDTRLERDDVLYIFGRERDLSELGKFFG